MMVKVFFIIPYTFELTRKQNFSPLLRDFAALLVIPSNSQSCTPLAVRQRESEGSHLDDGIPAFSLPLTHQDAEPEDYGNLDVMSFGNCGATQLLEL